MNPSLCKAPQLPTKILPKFKAYPKKYTGNFFQKNHRQSKKYTGKIFTENEGSKTYNLIVFPKNSIRYNKSQTSPTKSPKAANG
jgi:hypothetical protein